MSIGRNDQFQNKNYNVLNRMTLYIQVFHWPRSHFTFISINCRYEIAHRNICDNYFQLLPSNFVSFFINWTSNRFETVKQLKDSEYEP